MGNCNSCSSKGSCSGTACSEQKSKPKYGNIKHVIGVISGKGGVGKSTVTGILATKLKNAGYKVGVLDGDITGPSMPRFFGINEKRSEILPVENTEDIKFIPVETKGGIKVISLNLLTQEEDQPVIWRGPVITGVLKQMYQDTVWGDLDYLLIDMPPGTGDIALTIMQDTPLEGLVVVSTPQDMVSMIVKKVVVMAEKMKVDVLGIVENMSYVLCGNCNEKVRLFSQNSAEEQAEYLGAPLMSELPIDVYLVQSMEKGNVEEFINSNAQYNALLDNFMSKIN